MCVCACAYACAYACAGLLLHFEGGGINDIDYLPKITRTVCILQTVLTKVYHRFFSL